MCWRPLCPYILACGCKRAREWAETWAFLATQEETSEEQNVDVSVPQIAAKIPELVVIKVPQERVCSVDATVPHVELGGSLGEGGSS